MGMPLVSRKWMEDRKEMERVFGGVVERKWPICRLFCCFFLSYVFVSISICVFEIRSKLDRRTDRVSVAGLAY